MRINTVITALTALWLCACVAQRDEPVRIVGSSTIFPFAAKTAETYSERTGTPVVVEQTGSGGGHKLFCSGNPSIDATTSSRPQKPSETALCARNGVSPVVEIKLGFDGIVLARAVSATTMDLDPLSLYTALARDLPASGTDCTPVPNTYQRWSEIDARLPADEIKVYGPPPTSGTRDAFVETAMEAGARAFPCLAAKGKAEEDHSPERHADTAAHIAVCAAIPAQRLAGHGGHRIDGPCSGHPDKENQKAPQRGGRDGFLANAPDHHRVGDEHRILNHLRQRHRQAERQQRAQLAAPCARKLGRVRSEM